MGHKDLFDEHFFAEQGCTSAHLGAAPGDVLVLHIHAVTEGLVVELAEGHLARVPLIGPKHESQQLQRAHQRIPRILRSLRCQPRPSRHYIPERQSDGLPKRDQHLRGFFRGSTSSTAFHPVHLEINV